MKVDDLTILLKAVDKTKGAFNSVEKKLGKLGKLGKVVGGAIAGIGVSAITAFATATENGRQFFAELDTMRKLLGITTQEADGLVQSIRQFAPGAEVDKLQEALLTLEEGFFDAHAASGPLNDLIKDFGVNVDLGVEGANSQLVQFLKALKQIPGEADRVGAAIANLGADDAKPFIALARDVDKLDEAINLLSGSIDDIPNIVSQDDVERVERYTNKTKEMSDSWAIFSREAFALVAPALTAINSALDWAIQKATSFVGVLRQLSDNNGIWRGSMDEWLNEWKIVFGMVERSELSDNLSGQSQIDAINAIQPENGPTGNVTTGRIANEYGSFESEESFKTWLQEQKKITKAVLQTQELTYVGNVANPLSAEGGDDLAFLRGLDGANDGQFNINFPDPEAEQNAKIARLDKERQAYNDITDSINNMGSALQSIGEASGKSSDKTFKAFQRLQIAISTAAAISAAVQTLSDPTLGFFGKIAAYTKIAAIGFGAVAQLRSLNVGSSSATAPTASGGGVGNTGPQGTTQAQQQTSQRTIEINIQGTVFGPETIEQIIDEINDVDSGTKINANRIAA